MSDENINININVITKKSVTEVSKALDNVGRSGSSAAERIENGMLNAQDATRLLTAAQVALGIALATTVAVAAKSINVFKKFESGLINVDKVTNFSTKQLNAFGKEIDLLSRRVPIGTSELLNMAQTAGQLGIEGARNILNFTETVALLTKTTDLTVDSAQSLAQLLAVTNTSAGDIGRLGAVIVDLGNNFSATEAQILDVSTRIAQSTTQFNLLAEDAVKLGAVIAAVGEKSEASGTAIGKTFRSFNEAIKKGGEPLEELTRLTGLQREELSTLFESDPAELLRQFTRGMSGAIGEGRVLTDILGTFGLNSDRVTRVLGPLIKNTDKVDEAFNRTRVQMIKQSAATEEAAKQFASLESQEQFTANATTELAKTFGSILEPAYRSVLKIITAAAIGISDFINENQKLLKVVTISAVVVVAGLTAIGVAVFATTTAYASLAAAATAAYSVILLPLLPIIAALAAVGLAVGALIVYWDEFVLAIQRVNVVLLKFVSETLNVLATLEPTVRQLGALFGNILIAAIDSVSLAVIGLGTVIDKIFGTDTVASFKTFRENLKKTVDEFEKGGGVVKGLKNDVDDLTKTLEKDIKTQDAANEALAIRSAAIKALKKEQEELRNVEKETGKVRTRAQDQRLKQIQQELDVFSGLAAKRKELAEAEAAVAADVKKAELTELLRIQQKFDKQFNKLSEQTQLQNTKGIQDNLTKQLTDQITANRDKLIANGNFIEARNAQIELDKLAQFQKNADDAQKEKDKALEEERTKQQEIRDVKKEFKELEKEEITIEAEIKTEKDEAELDLLRARLEEIQLAKIESNQKEADLQGNHLEVLRKQRELDDKKREQAFKIRTDSEIRQDQAAAKVKGIIAQTSSQQLIGIGDNLMKAGIIRGKTAGNALKALKISEAVVNTYTGATLALSKFPGPAGILAAAGVVASGLANVATITAQKFATGGVVQAANGQSRSIDSIPALLSVGEEVLTTNNPRHRDNISREQDNAMIEELKGLRADIQNMQTIVNIDGKEVADVIQEQRFRGVN